LAANPGAVGILASSSLETPVIGLVARAGEPRFSLSATRERLAKSPLRDQLAQLGLEDEYAVLGSVIADTAALGRYAGAGPLNTDDQPLVAYRAPRVTYAPDTSPASRLTSLLDAVAAAPTGVLAERDAAHEQRLAAYWAARTRFIASGQNVMPTANAAEMLSQVRAPLLAVLRISPDFRPAYDPLVALAAALSRSDAERARALLVELSQAQPARPEAPQLLSRLDDVRR
jgi:spermidine synthase